MNGFTLVQRVQIVWTFDLPCILCWSIYTTHECRVRVCASVYSFILRCQRTMWQKCWWLDSEHTFLLIHSDNFLSFALLFVCREWCHSIGKFIRRNISFSRCQQQQPLPPNGRTDINVTKQQFGMALHSLAPCSSREALAISDTHSLIGSWTECLAWMSQWRQTSQNDNENGAATEAATKMVNVRETTDTENVIGEKYRKKKKKHFWERIQTMSMWNKETHHNSPWDTDEWYTIYVVRSTEHNVEFLLFDSASMLLMLVYGGRFLRRNSAQDGISSWSTGHYTRPLETNA